MGDNASAFNAKVYDEKIVKTLPYYEEFYKQITDIVSIAFDKSVSWLDVGYNALKPNGIFFNFENFATFSEVSEKLFLKRWEKYQIQNGKSEEESEKHIDRYKKGYFPITIDKHINALKECGFKCVEIIWVSNMQVGLMGMR